MNILIFHIFTLSVSCFRLSPHRNPGIEQQPHSAVGFRVLNRSSTDASKSSPIQNLRPAMLPGGAMQCGSG